MKRKHMQKFLSVVLSIILIVSAVIVNAEEISVETNGEFISKTDFLKLVCAKANVTGLLYEGGFNDIDNSHPDAELIAGALGAGVINSDFADGNGNFNGDELITNQEAVAMIVKALIKMKNDLSVGRNVSFEDKDEIDLKYLTYIEVAVANKIISDGGKFEPKGNITALEAVMLVAKMYDSYKRLPVVKGSGIMRIQHPVIENSGLEPPSFLKEGYKLVFQDEFEGNSLDTTKWGYNYSWGHSHNHAAWCVPENVIVENGILTLKGENVQHPDAVGKQGTFNNKKYDIIYTSGAINTQYKYNFDYGYFEAKLKMPSGKGMWPAWWMLKDGWPPEIDMLEILCSKPNMLHVNFHYGPAWNQHYSHEQVLDIGFDASEDFHVYGFEWTPDYMRYYVDGVQVGHDFTNKSAIKEATGMYMILNLAIDGWDGTPDETTQWPALYQCDYVRVWQIDE